MTNSTALTTTNQNYPEDEFSSVFSDLEPVDKFAVKKDYLAAQLAGLMIYCEKNRSDMANVLGWKKSRVTKVLSGKDNLTLKTVWDFSSNLGFDFDITFRAPNEPRPIQPWQITHREVGWLNLLPPIEVQTAHQVAWDLYAGNHKKFYLSVGIPDTSATGFVELEKQVPLQVPLNTVLGPTLQFKIDL